jgi:hypothetical protein
MVVEVTHGDFKAQALTDKFYFPSPGACATFEEFKLHSWSHCVEAGHLEKYQKAILIVGTSVTI